MIALRPADVGHLRDFELEIRVRNNRLKARRVALGLTQAEAARAAGVSAQDLCAYETLAKAPLGPRGWRSPAQKIARFFRVEPSDIWPEAVLAVKRNKAVRTADAAEVTALSAPRHSDMPTLPSPESMVIDAEEMAATGRAMRALTERERRVISMRFGLDDGAERTFTEIGEAIGVSSNRASQVVHVALRALRRTIDAGRKIEDGHAEAAAESAKEAAAAIAGYRRRPVPNEIGRAYTERHGPPRTGAQEVEDALSRSRP